MPVALPELTQDRLQVLKVPDDPPNPANVAKAYILLNQASSRASERQIFTISLYFTVPDSTMNLSI